MELALLIRSLEQPITGTQAQRNFTFGQTPPQSKPQKCKELGIHIRYNTGTKTRRPYKIVKT